MGEQITSTKLDRVSGNAVKNSIGDRFGAFHCPEGSVGVSVVHFLDRPTTKFEMVYRRRLYKQIVSREFTRQGLVRKAREFAKAVTRQRVKR